MRRRGFTLIELLVAITVMMVLLGLLLAGLRMAKLSQQRTSTRKQMRDLSMAVSMYLDRSPLLAQDFADRPWFYLVTAQRTAGREPLFESPVERLAKKVSGQWVAVSKESDAEAIGDNMLGVPTGMLVWTVVNDNANYSAAKYTKSIRITSTNATPTKPADDFWIEWTIAERTWATGP